MLGPIFTRYAETLKTLKKMITEHWKSEVSGKTVGKVSGLNFNVNEDRIKCAIPKCGFCGRLGHEGDPKCWKKHGRPKKKSRNGRYRNSRSSSSFKCYKCSGDHMKRDCPKLKETKDDKETSEGINGLFIHVMMCEEIEPEEVKIKVHEEEGKLSINMVMEKTNYKDALKKRDDDTVEFLGDTGAIAYFGLNGYNCWLLRWAILMIYWCI